MSLVKDFEKYNQEKMDELVERLNKDPLVAEAKAKWSTASEHQKLAALQRIANLQAEVYGFPKTTIELYEKAPEEKVIDGKRLTSISNGYYKHSDGKLFLNRNNKASFALSFEKAVNVTTHENAHRYQNHLADKLDRGEITKDDPTFEQAKIFKANRDRNGYTPPKEDFPTYKSQPLEDHSNIVGKYTSGKITGPIKK